MIILIKVALFHCVLLFSLFAYAGEKPDDSALLKKKVKLTVASAQINYVPYNYRENGEVKGFSIDILDYFSSHSKYDFEFVILPWSRVLRLVDIGEVDLIITLFKTPERAQRYHFIEPAYGHEFNKLFTLSSKNFSFDGQLSQLTPYSIGTIREYSYGEAFDQADYLKKLPAQSENVLVKLLLNGGVDMIIGNPFLFNKVIEQEQLTNQIRAIEPWTAKTPVHFALTKNRADALEIKQTLDKLTLQFKASAYYQQLLNKYQFNLK